MVFRAYISRPPLSAFVELLWFYEGDSPPHEKEHRLPDGSMELVINLQEDLLRVYDRQEHDRFRSFGDCLLSGAHSGFVVIAAEAIEFYKEVFGATELMRLVQSGGKILHAEIKVGDSPLMLTDESPEFLQMRSPQSLGGSPVHLFLYVEDVDATMDRAIAAGAEVLEPPEDRPLEGDRCGGFEDPFGFVWYPATNFEKISRKEIQERHEDAGKQ